MGVCGGIVRPRSHAHFRHDEPLKQQLQTAFPGKHGTG
jgi:hypothetical protein